MFPKGGCVWQWSRKSRGTHLVPNVILKGARVRDPKSESVCLRQGTFGSDPDSIVSLSFSMTVVDAWRLLIPDLKAH